MTQQSNVVEFRAARGALAPAKARGGYIRLYRSTLESAFSNKPNHLATWIHLLGMATHKPHKTMLGGRSIALQRGQFISGRKALAARVGITEKQLRNILDFMVDEGMITMDARRAGTIFTVLNFDFYQSDRGQPSTPAEATDNGASGEKRASDGPTKGQPRANDSGQPKGQPEASNTEGFSELGANEKASQESAKGATKYKNTNTTTSTRACETEQPDQPTRLENCSSDNRFSMHFEWCPTPEFQQQYAHYESMFGADGIQMIIEEFRQHWHKKSGTELAQSDWEEKFLRQLHWVRQNRGAAAVSRSPDSHNTAQQKRAALSSLVMEGVLNPDSNW